MLGYLGNSVVSLKFGIRMSQFPGKYCQGHSLLSPKPSKCISDIFNVTLLFFRSEHDKWQLAFSKDIKDPQSNKVCIL